MNVRILQLTEGARMATGTTVIIDVFRAFSLEAYMLAAGAREIYPIGDCELARKLKSENPELVLAGERGGRILPGFDTGNSPSELSKIDVFGKCVVHTTSAGTQGVANAINAKEILGGSLVNARATAEYIRKSGAEDVSLVCMGLEAKEPTEEDTLCAEYIKMLLLGEDPDISNEIADLKNTSGAKFFDSKNKDVFPTEDFFMCTELNKFDFAIKIKRTETGINISTKENVFYE